MKIFKFGGASIKDALGVKNVANILQQEGASNCLLVISAMGKMTNAFENIVNSYVNNDQEKLTESIDFTINYHTKIINDLFQDEHVIHQNITILFGEMIHFLAKNIAGRLGRGTARNGLEQPGTGRNKCPSLPECRGKNHTRHF